MKILPLCTITSFLRNKNVNFNVYSGHYFQCNESLMRTGSVKLQNNKERRKQSKWFVFYILQFKYILKLCVRNRQYCLWWLFTENRLKFMWQVTTSNLKTNHYLYLIFLLNQLIQFTNWFEWLIHELDSARQSFNRCG